MDANAAMKALSKNLHFLATKASPIDRIQFVYQTDLATQSFDPSLFQTWCPFLAQIHTMIYILGPLDPHGPHQRL